MSCEYSKTVAQTDRRKWKFKSQTSFDIFDSDLFCFLQTWETTDFKRCYTKVSREIWVGDNQHQENLNGFKWSV